MICKIDIEGEIGSDVTLESVRAQIDPSATSYEIYIDSTGGEVFTGESIFNELRRLNKPKTVIITGLCASIATLIASVGDVIKMFDVGHFMIHNPSVGLEGDAGDLRKAAGTLDQIKQILATVYGRRTSKVGIGKQQLWEMMDEETWMLPEQAKQMGFIDEVITAVPEEVVNKLKSRELKAVARMDFKKINMDNKTNKETDTILAKLLKKVDWLANMVSGKFKNNLNLQLEDGTTVIVVTEDDTWQGKQVTLEDGTPLQAGTYTTADGIQFTVDENSVITEVTQPSADTEAMKPEEAAKLKQENEALKKELETLKAAVTVKETEAAAVAENLKKFEASLKETKEELLKIQNTTAGDTKRPDKDGLNKGERTQDPMLMDMAGLGDAWLTSHGYKSN